MRGIVVFAWIATGIFGILFIIRLVALSKIQTDYGSPISSLPYVLGVFSGNALIPVILWIIAAATWSKSKFDSEDEIIKSEYNKLRQEISYKTIYGQLRLLAILEGISYISFGLTMPLKYMMNIKGPNYIVGVLHGILFIAYCLWVILNHFDRKWPIKRTAILLIASLIPFMTFWADWKILKKIDTSS